MSRVEPVDKSKIAEPHNGTRQNSKYASGMITKTRTPTTAETDIAVRLCEPALEMLKDRFPETGRVSLNQGSESGLRRSG